MMALLFGYHVRPPRQSRRGKPNKKQTLPLKTALPDLTKPKRS